MDRPKKRILCVEDHQDMCELITNVLDDYDVVVAYSKADALLHATSERFDLYLLDYHLPDGTGLELCLFIRAFDPETPIFFCTATSAITETQIKRAGAQRLIKLGPKFVNRLKSAISQVLST